MEASNHFCDIPNCRNPAEKFVITNTEKIRVCSIHISNLIEKRLTIYDMEAFNFIQSAADLPLYETRRAEAQVGIGNLTVLEAACDRELREALEAIEKSKLKAVQVIEAAYELHKNKIQSKYQETMESFQVIRNNLERYRLLKEAQLNPEEQVLRQNLAVVPRFLRVVVTDSSLELAQIAVKSLKSSDLITTKTILLLDTTLREAFITELTAQAEVHWKNGLYEISEEERLYAQSLGSTEELDHRIEEVTTTRRMKLVKMLELTMSEEEVKQFSLYYRAKAVQEFTQAEQAIKEKKSAEEKEGTVGLLYATQQYEKSLMYWGAALHLLRMQLPKDQLTARLSFEYGKFLFEQWDLHSEASNVLRQSLEIEQTLNPYSEESEKTTVLLIRVLCFEDNKDQAVKLIRSTLAVSNQNIRHVLYCLLTWVSSYTSSREETEQMLTKCVIDKNKVDSEYTPLSLTALGYAYNNLRQYAEAETMFQDALAIYKIHFPASSDIANTLNNLGNVLKSMTRYKTANSMYQEALAKLRTDFPMSRQVAMTLTYIGELYRDMQKYSDSETAYKEVLELYETRCPHIEEGAKTYRTLGLLLKDSSLNERVEKYLKQALKVYQRDFPNTEGAVGTLGDLGQLYYDRNKEKVWIALYQEGLALMVAKYPTSEHTANMYKRFGALFVDSKRYQEAVNMWEFALAIHQTNSPISEKTAQVLSDLGSLYEELKRYEDAEKSYQSAFAIYQSYVPVPKETINMLLKLAKVYSSVKKYAEAFNIYQAYFPTFEFTANTALILADQYSEANNYEYAEWMYRNALVIFKNISPSSTETINTLTKLGLFYQKNQRYAEAEPVFLEALEVYRNQNPDPVKLSELLLTLGNMYYTLNKFSEAETMFRETLKINQTHLLDSEILSDTLFSLGNSCYSCGRFAEAEVEYQKALKLYKARKPNSSKTAMTLFQLGKVCEALSRTREAIAYTNSAMAVWKASDKQEVNGLESPGLILSIISKQVVKFTMKLVLH